MEQLILKIAYVSLIAGFISLLVLQLSPSKYTLTKAAQIFVNKNLRQTLWSLPFHMLAIYGKSLKVTGFVLMCCGLLLSVGYLYVQ